MNSDYFDSVCYQCGIYLDGPTCPRCRRYDAVHHRDAAAYTAAYAEMMALQDKISKAEIEAASVGVDAILDEYA